MASEGLIKVAEELVKNKDQFFQKSSINRAYYASFHLVKGVAGRYLGFVEDGDKPTHRQLSKHLMDSDNEDIKDIGIKLRNLHRQRTNCDYKLDTKLGKNDAVLAILMGKSLIEQFPEICKSVSD